MRAGYTETEFVGYYIYNIVANKKFEWFNTGQNLLVTIYII